MDDNNASSNKINLEQCEGFSRFLEYLFLYERYVLNPSTDITLLFAMENNIKK